MKVDTSSSFLMRKLQLRSPVTVRSDKATADSISISTSLALSCQLLANSLETLSHKIYSSEGRHVRHLLLL